MPDYFTFRSAQTDQVLAYAELPELAGRRGVDFLTFAEPGYAKMALSYRLENGLLTTETRVRLTDADAHRSFRRYWLVIRPFSGLIRRAWLRAIARRASG